MPKQARKLIPLIGLPFLAIQASRTASTGVVQGDDANPKANPAAIGANGAGAFSFQTSGSGPVCKGKVVIPKRLSPMKMANNPIKIEKKAGNWP